MPLSGGHRDRGDRDADDRVGEGIRRMAQVWAPHQELHDRFGQVLGLQALNRTAFACPAPGPATYPGAAARSSACFLARAASSTAYSASSIAAYA